ncbi:relaxase/mobilization nuclease domain-containing protein [Arthrobacter sp. M4]|uniref:relaxase/mobilization nuclease domain-containing protein n=1 Tax=Arthrobacter sp. M4 TaxID=218160 RepID=UPI001CDD45CE|nr:relaxase/mobilization nuclease domain-containing protein [Arthrobacter sp. M4]MCA4135484.1 relaxase/mobilization nuclease domain-containing protein [Arthrobacter sp. M4]
MFAKITKGTGAVKIAVYLAGPGRSNEHTNQHVVCASEMMATVDMGTELDHHKAVALGYELDHPNRVYGRGSKRQHIWHASLSLDAKEGVRDDVFWEGAVREFLTEMKFEGVDGEDYRWVAVRHGLSSNGNDHVHIAVSMVSESGKRWATDKDWPRASAACREIEKRHGLRLLNQGVKTPGYAEGELHALARRRAYALHEKQRSNDELMVPWKFLDRTAREQLINAQMPEVQPRYELAMKLRAATAGARSEGEFVRRARGNSMLVRPRYAEGGKSAVVGYSVALKPVHGEKPIWYGGGRLGGDLSLPSLRAGWPEQSPAAALPEWEAARRNRPVVSPEPGEVSGVELAQYFEELSHYLRTVSEVSVDDPVAYARIAREGAGLFSAWAVAAGKDGDEAAKDLREAATIFAKHSQLTEQPARAVQEPSLVYGDLCTHVAISKSRRAGAVAVVRAWSSMGEHLGGAFKAHGWAVRSESLSTELRTHLDSVHDRYRSVNPLPSQAPSEGAVATIEKPVRLSAAQVREARLQRIETRMREEGVPEKAIEARMFAERQQAGAPVERRGRIPGISKHVGQDKAQQQQRGHQEGKGL